MNKVTAATSVVVVGILIWIFATTSPSIFYFWKSLEQLLIEYVENEDIEKFKKIINETQLDMSYSLSPKENLLEYLIDHENSAWMTAVLESEKDHLSEDQRAFILFESISSEKMVVFSAAVNNFTDVQLVDEHDRNLLHHIASKCSSILGCDRYLREIIDANVEAFVKDDSGKTPFDYLEDGYENYDEIPESYRILLYPYNNVEFMDRYGHEGNLNGLAEFILFNAPTSMLRKCQKVGGLLSLFLSGNSYQCGTIGRMEKSGQELNYSFSLALDYVDRNMVSTGNSGQYRDYISGYEILFSIDQNNLGLSEQSGVIFAQLAKETGKSNWDITLMVRPSKRADVRFMRSLVKQSGSWKTLANFDRLIEQAAKK